MLRDFVTQLQNWSDDQELIAAALEGCQSALQHAAREDEELDFLPLHGWRLDQLHYRFVKQALVFRNEHLRGSYLDTEVEIYVESTKSYYPEGHCSVGSYRYITDLDGKPVNDYLIFEVSPEEV